MEIIEKDGMTIKSHDGYYNDKYASKGVAGTGLGLGIAGTALGLMSLFGNRGGVAPAIIGGFNAGGCNAQDTLALTNEMWALKTNTLNEMYAHRDVDVNEKFQLWKSQVDADFGLYKSTRDSFDILANRISALETQVAVNSAVRPYQDKLLQSEIAQAHTNAINYTDRKTCKAIYGQVVLSETPTVTEYVGANSCGCPTIVSASSTSSTSTTTTD